MLDKNGRPIEVGDVIALPYDNNNLIELARAIKDGVLGQVVETFTEKEGYLIVDENGKRITATTDVVGATNTLNLYEALGVEVKGLRLERAYVHLGDGTTHPAADIVTLSGLEWVECQDCGFPWPFDTRMSEEEECPSCGAFLRYYANGEEVQE